MLKQKFCLWWIWYLLFDNAHFQRWLAWHRRRGWELAHVGGLFFHFTRGDGTDYRYYVQVMKDFPWTEQGRAYIAGVEELGVTYLGCFLHRAYFRWVDDGRPEEMFSDLASQAQEARCVRSAQIFAAALCALGAAMQFYTAWEYLYAAQIYEELYAELIAAGGPSVVAAWMPRIALEAVLGLSHAQKVEEDQRRAVYLRVKGESPWSRTRRCCRICQAMPTIPSGSRSRQTEWQKRAGFLKSSARCFPPIDAERRASTSTACR